MNSDDQDASLESLLRGVPLRAPSDALDARVEATFAEFRSHQPRRLRLYPFALAACLLIAIGIGVRLALPKSHPTAVAIRSVSHPIQIERVTSSILDDGVIAGTDGAAYRKFRRRTVREIWYVDPITHSQMQITIPVNQILIQKVEAF